MLDLKKNKRKIEKVVKKVCEENGAELIDSYITIGDINFPKTVSLYYKVKDNGSEYRFRISDHPMMHKNLGERFLIPSIYICEKSTLKSIANVVYDRIMVARHGDEWLIEKFKGKRLQDKELVTQGKTDYGNTAEAIKNIYSVFNVEIESNGYEEGERSIKYRFIAKTSTTIKKISRYKDDVKIRLNTKKEIAVFEDVENEGGFIVEISK